MPRKAPAEIIEHRVTLGNVERDALQTAIRTAQANVALDSVTATLNSVALALSGGGLLLGAGVLALWKAPEIFSIIKDGAKDAVDGFVKEVSGENGKLDNLSDWAFNEITDIDGNPVSLRRRAQALAKRRGEVNKAINAYCTHSASTYDQVKCQTAQEAKDQYFTDLKLFQDEVALINQRYDEWIQNRYKDSTRESRIDELIYSGLGDIDPNYQP